MDTAISKLFHRTRTYVFCVKIFADTINDQIVVIAQNGKDVLHLLPVEGAGALEVVLNVSVWLASLLSEISQKAERKRETERGRDRVRMEQAETIWFVSQDCLTENASINGSESDSGGLTADVTFPSTERRE